VFTIPEEKWLLVGVQGSPNTRWQKISNSEYDFTVILDEGCYGMSEHTCTTTLPQCHQNRMTGFMEQLS
jgi:hypothetical protein